MCSPVILVVTTIHMVGEAIIPIFISNQCKEAQHKTKTTGSSWSKELLELNWFLVMLKLPREKKCWSCSNSHWNVVMIKASPTGKYEHSSTLLYFKLRVFFYLGFVKNLQFLRAKKSLQDKALFKWHVWFHTILFLFFFNMWSGWALMVTICGESL